MNDSKLLAETLDLLRAPDRPPLREIAEATGVGFHWLGKLAQGKFEDPGVKKIEAVHRYLTGKDRADKIAATG